MRSNPPFRLMTPHERRRYWVGYWRIGVPALTAILAIMAMTAPLPLALPAFPQLGLLVIFVWAILQPALMPPAVAFVVGAVADALFGQPIGVNATLFALAAGFVRLFERRVGQHGHMFDWGVATVLVTVFELLTTQLMALAGRPVPLAPQLWQALTTIAAYPAIVWLVARIQRRVFGSQA